MSTRANLAVQNADGVWIQNYVHFDGYPEHMVPALERFQTKQEAIDLVMGGDVRFMDTREVEYYGGTKAVSPGPRPRKENDHLYIFVDGIWKTI